MDGRADPDEDREEAPPQVPVEPDPPTTPYARLHALLVRSSRCAHCGRSDTLTPAEVAEMVGLSESAVRRLTSPEATPSMRALTVMADRLGLSRVTLLAKLWPETELP